MSDYESLFSQAFALFSEQKFAESLFKLAEAERHLITLGAATLMSSLENLKGFNYLGLQNYKLAQESFEKALKINPHSSQACAGLGEVFYLFHDDQHSKTMFEWGVINDVNNKFAVLGLAKVNKLLGISENHNSLLNADGGEESVNSEDDIKTIMETAADLFDKNRHLEAIHKLGYAEGVIVANFNRLKELITSLLVMKGEGFLRICDLDKAQEEFEKVLNYCPESSKACWGLGEVLANKKMYEEAKTMYEFAIKHDPSDLENIKSLVLINRKLGFADDHNDLFN